MARPQLVLIDENRNNTHASLHASTEIKNVFERFFHLQQVILREQRGPHKTP
jgi:hypothetical protein